MSTDGNAQMAAEIEVLKTQLRNQNSLIQAITANAERPFRPELPPPLSILPGNPGAEDQFEYSNTASGFSLTTVEPITDDSESGAVSLSHLKTKKKPIGVIDSCKWCGRSHARDRNDCPARGALCGKCKEKGHFQKLCPSKDSGSNLPKRPLTTLAYMPRLFSMTEDSDLTFVSARIGGIEVEAMLDSGASGNFISEDLWSRTQAKIIEDPKSVEVANKQVVRTLGSCRLERASWNLGTYISGC